ncbi:hypothetical protein AWH63_10525 [Marinobacter sp. C18]|uniref:hypothetical protein n=1 Tax=Marinobacter sp. C18 TaxID=1772288 RepID=UPI000963B0A0|nr:hypothetical protein [Marinobacter sp. C18]OLF81965.1 hypothetical protein AWH63_10525 [Marinobacter sp. C18]
MTDESPSTQSGLPFAKGYPINVTAHQFLETAETMMVSRAASRGILEVAVEDANVPLAGAMRRDLLLPVLIDYTNYVIHPQADLQYDSALNDELIAGVAADLASKDNREPTIDDVGNADAMAQSVLRRTPLINVRDDHAGIGARTEMNSVAGMPLSVSLLMLDTALESAHNLSLKHQQETLGVAEPEVLDLTPVCQLLASMNVSEHINQIPTNVHERLQAILAGSSPSYDKTETVNPMYDALNEDADRPDQENPSPEVNQ